MKIRALILGSLFLLFFSNLALAQTEMPVTSSAKPADVWKLRRARIKADILKEIAKLRAREQAEAYVELADSLHDLDSTEAKYWLKRGVELALDPATTYVSDKSKIEAWDRLLRRQEIMAEDPPLQERLLNSIKDLLFAVVANDGPDGYGDTAITLAERFVGTSDTAAYDLAVIALKDRQTHIDWYLEPFLLHLQAQDRTLGDKFFAALIEQGQNTGGDPFLEKLVKATANSSLDHAKWWEKFSEDRQLALFGVVADFIQEHEAKSGDVCEFATEGVVLIEDFRRILPNRSAQIYKAAVACQVKDPEHFHFKEYGTLPEIIAAAKAMPDVDRRANFLYWSWLSAKSEKHYQLALDVLDSADEGTRSRFKDWDDCRIEVTAYLLQDRLANDDYSGGDELIEHAPEGLRPYIILNALHRSLGLAYAHPEQFVRLVERARAEFRKMIFPLPTTKAGVLGYEKNPASFVSLAYQYVLVAMSRRNDPARRQYVEKALGVWDEFMEVQNQLSSRYTNRLDDGTKISYVSFGGFPQETLETDFDRIYDDISRLEFWRIRLGYRFGFLRAAENRHGGSAFYETIPID